MADELGITNPVPNGHREGTVTVRRRPVTARSLTSDRAVHTIINIPNQQPPGSLQNPLIALRRDMFVSQPVMEVRGIDFQSAKLR